MPRATKPSTGRSLWERQRDAIRAAKAAAAASSATGSENPADLTTTLISEPTNVAAEINTPPRFTFPPPAAPAPAPPEPAAGTYRIDQLRLGQCRFACTPHEAREHRFCGAATEIGPGNLHGSWCPVHLPVVTCMPGRTPGGASKADVVAKVQEDVA